MPSPPVAKAVPWVRMPLRPPRPRSRATAARPPNPCGPTRCRPLRPWLEDAQAKVRARGRTVPRPHPDRRAVRDRFPQRQTQTGPAPRDQRRWLMRRSDSWPRVASRPAGHRERPANAMPRSWWDRPPWPLPATARPPASHRGFVGTNPPWPPACRRAWTQASPRPPSCCIRPTGPASGSARWPCAPDRRTVHRSLGLLETRLAT